VTWLPAAVTWLPATVAWLLAIFESDALKYVYDKLMTQ